MTERERKLVELGVIDTSLTEGCRIRDGITEYKISSINSLFPHWDRLAHTQYASNYLEFTKYVENLWHPLMIGDVMKRIIDNCIKNKETPKMYSKWEDILFEVINKWRDNLSLPFHSLAEENQKAVCDLLCWLK
jgi:hypothetical protein